MRWTKAIGSLAVLLAAAAGCKQSCFIQECDWKHYQDDLANWTEFKPELAQKPSLVHVGTPANVNDPDRPPRYLSLAEAISVALERGTTGQGLGLPTPNGP